MGRPKLDPRAAQSATVSGKVLPAEKEALDKVIALVNAERRASGEMLEISITDWIRSHIRRDARDRGVEIHEPGVPGIKAPPKGGKPPRKAK